MNNAITCTGCSKPFEGNNLPRIANCLHTYCQYCLTRLHSCPMDKEPIVLGPAGLNEFPLNRTISKIMGLAVPELPPPVTHSMFIPTSQPLPEPQPRLSEDPNFNLCLLHRKQADLVCIDHGIRICSNCALFGQHKLHEIKTVDSVVEQCATVAEQTVAIMCQIKRIQEKVSMGTVYATLDQAFREKKEVMTKALRMKFNRILDQVRKSQDMALEELHLLLQIEKEGVRANLKIDELQNKKKDWFRSAAELGQLMNSISLKKKIEEATVYLNQRYQQSRVVKIGQYLIMDINNTEKLISDKIASSVEDFNFETDEDLEGRISNFCRVYKISERNGQTDIHEQKTDRVDDEFLLEELNKMNINDSNQMNNSIFSENVLEMPVLLMDRLDMSTPSWIERSERCNDKQFIKEKEQERCLQPLYQPVNNEQKRKKKLKIPEKYESIVEDLRCDKTDCIDLTNAQLGDGVIISLCDYIRNTTKLRTIKLIRNKLTDEAFVHIMQACSESKVTSLNLGQNQLTDKALEIASKCSIKDLRNITLSQNRLNQRNSKNKVAEFKKVGVTISL